jgi:Ca2+-binding RTX toxin-like protein
MRTHTRSSIFVLVLVPLLAPLLGLAATPAQAASGDCTTANGQTTCTFTYTGAAQTWTVPAEVAAATFDVYGAQGGSSQSAGGRGGEARATLGVVPGQTFQIMVGGAGGAVPSGISTGGAGGFNGGALGGDGPPRSVVHTELSGGGGGGASDVRTASGGLTDRLLVAGGGGGGGGGSGGGGGGGGYYGGGGGGVHTISDGAGGTQTAGGSGGASACRASNGGNGDSGTGGPGGDSDPAGCVGTPAGTGGAGGGSTGGNAAGAVGGGGGGGGGSGYGPAGVEFQSGVREGHGLVIITYSPDTTAPTASPSQSPAVNDAGWNTSDVSVSWNWVDNPDGIGLDSGNCTTSSTSSGEGEQTLSATCADLAGNQGNASYTLKVDKTVPSISAAATTQPNAAGWYNRPVTVQFTCADALSGVASCPSDQSLSSEGAAASSTAQTASDVAGNTSALSNVVTAAIDRTAPSISAAATTAPNAAGWYNAPVTVQFTCADALSGVASCPPDQTLSGEGSAVSSTAQTASDVADNTSAPSNLVTVQIDRTVPTLAPTISPSPVRLGSVAMASANASDALSGIASQSCGALDTSSLGVKSVSCSATDRAGNSASISIGYQVLPPGCEGQSATIYVTPQGRIVGGKDNGKLYAGVLNGTTGNDVFVGTAGDDEVDAKAGNDLICGLGGDDELTGDDGTDTIYGGEGHDTLKGSAGVDTMYGEGGDDDLDGDSGNDTLDGGVGEDFLDGDGDNDTLTGGANADTFKGGSGTDTATDFTPAQGDTRSSVERP